MTVNQNFIAVKQEIDTQSNFDMISNYYNVSFVGLGNVNMLSNDSPNTVAGKS